MSPFFRLQSIIRAKYNKSSPHFFVENSPTLFDNYFHNDDFPI
jgi:hypothetical protein